MNRETIRWVTPDWDLPSVRALSTLRSGGVSSQSYQSLNLATHVGDRGESVTENRRLLKEAARLPRDPFWLEQVHGARVALHDDSMVSPQADASVAFSAGRVCAVLTADCLPVVLTDGSGSRIAVAHAGWRGLVAGVLTATVQALRSDPAELLAWLGPAISSDAFEVGGEVRDAFMARHDDFAAAFVANERGRYQADLCALARIELGAAGVTEVSGGHWCTAKNERQFFSFRRDGRCGRMATLAWLDRPAC